MSCTICAVSCNFATHATCLLALTTYKYNELQVSSTTQKLSYKASCKTHFFLIVNTKVLKQKLHQIINNFMLLLLLLQLKTLQSYNVVVALIA
jgi:hypothetical protein